MPKSVVPFWLWMAITVLVPGSLAAQCQIDRFEHPDFDESNDFGFSVDLLDDVMVIGNVGGFSADDDRSAVFVYRNEDGDWVEEQVLQPEDASGGDRFGSVLALGPDLIAASASAFFDPAVVYLFEYDGEEWVEAGTLNGNEDDAADSFGRAVAVDDDLIVVGAYRDAAAYIFRRDEEGEWVEEARVEGDEDNSQFGLAVGVSDGVVAVGARNEGNSRGAVFMFEYDEDEEDWVQVQKLEADDPDAENGDQFGECVAMDGDVLIVAVQDWDDFFVDVDGAVYVYRKDEDGEWQFEQLLTTPDFGNFATRADVQGDRIVVTAPSAEIGDAEVGALHSFEFDGEAWDEVVRLLPVNARDDTEIGSSSVAVDGDLAIVGAPNDRNHKGAAYQFSLVEPENEDECQVPTTIFVDIDAPDGGNGEAWATAYNDLSIALDAASRQGNMNVWVAEGTYVPSTHFFPSGDLSLLGGFAGDEDRASERSPVDHPTILDGEKNAGNIIFLNNDDNLLIDGFTIRNGNARPSGDAEGGALLAQNCDGLVISNCIFENNMAAGSGGALEISSSGVRIVDCVFRNNQSLQGGAVAFDGYSARIVRCVFEGNEITEEGNTGGAVHNRSNDIAIVACGFYSNIAVTGGGAISTRGGDVWIDNCVFTGNEGGDHGGAIFSERDAGSLDLNISNCTFYGNHAEDAGGVWHDEATDAPLVASCIFWENTDGDGSDQDVDGVSAPTVRNTRAEDVGTLNGNINDDPRLVDPDGPDDIIGTPDDDIALDGDSPCIDAGRNSTVPADLADVDDDGDVEEEVPHDFAGQPRRIDALYFDDSGNGTAPFVDMGAWEFDGLAFLRGDANGNGRVNFQDAIKIIYSVMNPEVDCLLALDTDNNGKIDFEDALLLLRYLFISGPEPEPPFPNCGYRLTKDELPCGPTEGCP